LSKVGKYELVRKLANGGMAEVFLARSEWMGGLAKTVVVKRILAPFAEDPAFIEMFFAEARLASLLSHPNIEMPKRGNLYSVNEANADGFPESYRTYLSRLRSRGYGSRYIGSLVADFHRTLLKGGVFLYPPTKKNPNGKLRLLYEANPLAFIAEQAGGYATSGKTRIMDIEPETIHERTPFIIGSRTEVLEFDEIHNAAAMESATG